jgi:hypothetical protein
MNKTVGAIEALHDALGHLDRLGHHAAAAHVSMAISLLYDDASSEFKLDAGSTYNEGATVTGRDRACRTVTEFADTLSAM